jgi:hypothetical protein
VSQRPKLAWSARRVSCFLEALAFAALVALYIWRLQAASLWSWILLFAWLTVSFLLRKDTPETMGWRADNLWSSTLRALWFFVPASLLLCAAGLFLGMLHRLPEHLIDSRRFVGYLSFCLLQQVALNSFLSNRLLYAFQNSVSAALVSGALFAILHWPNPVLVPLTLIGGVAMAWLFARERNILPLTLGQAILGALVWWAFPVLWHHSMRVGPGYSTFHM